MNFFEAIRSVFKNYANFSGRACRSEYWWWTLFYCLTDIVAIVIDAVLFSDYLKTHDYGPVYIVKNLIFFLPSLAVGVRRLHDVHRSGWNLLWIFTIIGIIPVLFYWPFKQGDINDNRFGADPLEGKKRMSTEKFWCVVGGGVTVLFLIPFSIGLYQGYSEISVSGRSTVQHLLMKSDATPEQKGHIARSLEILTEQKLSPEQEKIATLMTVYLRDVLLADGKLTDTEFNYWEYFTRNFNKLDAAEVEKFVASQLPRPAAPAP